MQRLEFDETARRPLASLGSSNAMDGAPKDTRETKAVMGAIEKERGLRDMQEVSVCCRLPHTPSLTRPAPLGSSCGW